MTSNDDAGSGSGEVRARARRQVDAVLDELRKHDGALTAEASRAVSHALSLAREALTAERTECRKKTPYSDLLLVGDPDGLHYECSHDPVHVYPL